MLRYIIRNATSHVKFDIQNLELLAKNIKQDKNGVSLLSYCQQQISMLEKKRPSRELNIMYKLYAHLLIQTNDDMDKEMALAILERGNSKFPCDWDLYYQWEDLYSQMKQE